MSKVYKLCTVDLKYGETIEYCLAVLKELDCKMIFSRALLPVQAILSLIRTVNMAKKLTKDDYQNLKPMSDPKDQATMLLTQRLTIVCYLHPSPKDSFLLIISLTKMVQISLKKGGALENCRGACVCYFRTVLTHAALSDFGTAAYFCEMTLLLQQRTSSKYSYTGAITLFNSHASCLAWIMPILSCLPLISKAYGTAAYFCEMALLLQQRNSSKCEHWSDHFVQFPRLVFGMDYSMPIYLLTIA
jgi:hypothetical protein